MTFTMEINDFWYPKITKIKAKQTQNKENRDKITHHIAKSSRGTPKSIQERQKTPQKKLAII